MGVARFNGSAEFPGPTRFMDGWMGQGFQYPLSGGSFSTDFQAEGVLGRGVVQTGRLVLSSAGLLTVRLADIRGLAEALTVGTLDTGEGRTWPGITMLRLRLDGPVDRGRVWSVGYTIDYAYLP